MKKTTVLFVSHDQKNMRPVSVSTNLLRFRKLILLAAGAIFVGLTLIIILLVGQYLNGNQQLALLSQKIRSMHILASKIDTNLVREKFSHIDQQLLNINNSLKERGLRAVFKEGIGGEPDHDIGSFDELSDFYETYLKKINYTLDYTPLGAPFPGAITSTFGHRENPFNGSGIETHKGLDIRGPMGAPVRAMANGVVIFAGRRGGFGNCIMIKHANGFETLYGHLSKILITNGQQIKIGDQIGNIGSTGRSTGPHLHYEVHKDGQRINPQTFLNFN